MLYKCSGECLQGFREKYYLHGRVLHGTKWSEVLRVQGGDFSSEKSSGETCPDLSNQRSGNYLCTGNGFSVSSTSISKSGTTYGVDHPPLPRKLKEFPTCPAGGGVASIWSAAEDSRYGDGSRRHVEAGRPAVSAPRAYRVRDRKERFIVYKVRYS